MVLFYLPSVHRREIGYVVHHKDVQQDTLVRYAYKVSTFLAFVMRVEEMERTADGSNCLVKLTQAQTVACRKLRDQLRTDPVLARIRPERYYDPDVVDLNGEQDGDDDEEDDEEDQQGDGVQDSLESNGQQPSADNLVPSDVTEGFLPIPPSPLVPLEGLQPSPMSRFWCPRVQRQLHETLGAFYTHLPKGDDGRWYNALLRFTPYSSRRPDGTYHAPGFITQIIAALTFTGRIYMFSVIHEALKRNPGTRYAT